MINFIPLKDWVFTLKNIADLIQVISQSQKMIFEIKSVLNININS